jgi:hypothetical protein
LPDDMKEELEKVNEEIVRLMNEIEGKFTEAFVAFFHEGVIDEDDLAEKLKIVNDE